jgi:hypothetical protein
VLDELARVATAGIGIDLAEEAAVIAMVCA